MKKFCVISDVVTTRIPRTWKETEEEAAEHARALVQRAYTEKQGPVRFFVVQIMRVVEVGMPEVKERQPTDSDTTSASLEDD